MMDLTLDFETYWRKMNPLPKYDNRKQAARDAWNSHPNKQRAIMTWLQQHGDYPARNPYFFILDFTVPIPRGEPTNYRGKAIPSGLQVFSAKHNGEWGMYTEADIRNFNMQLPQN